MSFGKMNGFADIVKTKHVKRMKSLRPFGCIRKDGTAASDGQTSLHSVKRPICSAFGVFRG